MSAVVSVIVWLTDTSQHRVTQVVRRGTVTRVETSLTMITLRTRVLAPVSTEAWPALALTSDRVTLGIIVTVALVLTIWTKHVRRTLVITRVPSPASWTLTLPGHVVTLSSGAATRVTAAWTIGAWWTRVLTIVSSESWATHTLTMLRVTGGGVALVRTVLTTPHTKQSLVTLLSTHVTLVT